MEIVGGSPEPSLSEPKCYIALMPTSRVLAGLEGQFLQHLDLLKRDVLSETEFSMANEVARSQSTALEARREELSNWLEEQRSRVSNPERLPGAIELFVGEKRATRP